jgi:heme/copper-type cytochrome/quinol oxidase subunit 2
MSGIIEALLVINPLKTALFVLLDYIGMEIGNINVRIAFTSISLIINLFFLALFVYISFIMFKYDLEEGFDHNRRVKMIFLVISITVISVIFTLNYFSFENAQEYCKNIATQDRLLLTNLEKGLTLVYFVYIIYMIYNVYKSYKKFKNGILMESLYKLSTVGTTVLIFLMSVMKGIQLKLLVDKSEQLNKANSPSVSISPVVTNKPVVVNSQ